MHPFGQQTRYMVTQTIDPLNTECSYCESICHNSGAKPIQNSIAYNFTTMPSQYHQNYTGHPPIQERDNSSRNKIQIKVSKSSISNQNQNQNHLQPASPTLLRLRTLLHQYR